MGRVIYQYKDYAIRICEKNYKVYFREDEEFCHGHTSGKNPKDLKKCKDLIGMMDKGKVPREDFWREFARRAAKPGKYKDLLERKAERDRDKDHYINIKKGPVKK